MNVTVNGEQKEMAESGTVSDLISALGLDPGRLAVELNRRIIRRAEWDSTILNDGDKVEIVHFVGGGAR